MNSNIKVSVIVVTYNQENYIDEAIQSIILQNFNYQYEIIIGDDCSTDSTLDHCHKWQERYPNTIKIVTHKKNVGIQQNYIDTYNHCQGEYIAICEGDDFWCSKHKLHRQVTYMDKHPKCNICFHRVINYYTANNTKSLSNGKNTKTDSDITDLSKSNYITNLSVMYRRNAIDCLPDWLTEIHSPDYVIHMLHANTGYIHYINRPMAVYRQHANGIWCSNIKEKRLIISLNSREKLIDYFSSNEKVVKNLINSYTPIALNLLSYYNEIGEKEKADNIKEKILLLNSKWDYSILEEHLNAFRKIQETTARLRLINILKSCRASFSKLIPIPRIKN